MKGYGNEVSKIDKIEGNGMRYWMDAKQLNEQGNGVLDTLFLASFFRSPPGGHFFQPTSKYLQKVVILLSRVRPTFLTLA